MKDSKHFCCLEALNSTERRLSALQSQRDLERVRLLAQKSGWIQNEFVHDGSVKHPCTSSSLYPHQQFTQTPQTGRQVDGTRRGQSASGGGGWAILIQCLLYLEREEANGAFLTRLTLDQSHHTFSQGT